MRWRWRVVAAGVAIGGVAAALVWLGGPKPAARRVVTPALSAEAQAGQPAFERRCAQCHGLDAGGSANGPPLVDRTYHPGLHSDVAFSLAVQRGVRAHHWRFGDMPPAPTVTSVEVSQMTQYVRALQKANGIY